MINLRISRRTIAIISVAALLLFAVVYVKINADVSSLNESAKSSLVASKSSVKQQIEALNRNLSSDELARSKKEDKITEFIVFLRESIDSTCKDQFGSPLAVFSTEVSRCKDMMQTLGKVKLSAEKIVELIKIEEKIASYVPIQNQTTGYKSTYNNWKSAVDSIEALGVMNDVVSAKDELVSAMKTHSLAWGKLVGADENRNAKVFDLANTEIGSSYKKLAEAVGGFKATMNEYLSAFSADLGVYYEQ